MWSCHLEVQVSTSLLEKGKKSGSWFPSWAPDKSADTHIQRKIDKPHPKGHVSAVICGFSTSGCDFGLKDGVTIFFKSQEVGFLVGHPTKCVCVYIYTRM